MQKTAVKEKREMLSECWRNMSTEISPSVKSTNVSIYLVFN